MSRTGEEYSTTWTRNPAEAGKVPIDKIYIGMKWVRDSLEKDNFGRDYGYSYCGFVELSDGTTTTYLWCL